MEGIGACLARLLPLQIAIPKLKVDGPRLRFRVQGKVAVLGDRFLKAKF